MMERIYYSPEGYWKGLSAIKKLAAAAKVSESEARDWLKKQAIWQIYLPAPRYIPRPYIDEDRPNAVHQADLLFLPHDRVQSGRAIKTFKYALTVVDVASRYKEAEPLAEKSSAAVAVALERIYKREPLSWPRLFQVDPGREFMGAVSQLAAKHDVRVRRGQAGNHRQQAIVERFNRTLAERLFGAQYAQELLLAARGSTERSAEWVQALPRVVAALNGEVTRLTGRKPVDAIKSPSVSQAPAAGILPARVKEPLIPSGAQVRYLYASSPGEHELEGGRRRATDPVWSLTLHEVRSVVSQEGQPSLYRLATGPARSFVREELLIVPPDTELPPDRILKPERAARLSAV